MVAVAGAREEGGRGEAGGGGGGGGGGKGADGRVAKLGMMGVEVKWGMGGGAKEGRGRRAAGARAEAVWEVGVIGVEVEGSEGTKNPASRLI